MRVKLAFIACFAVFVCLLMFSVGAYFVQSKMLCSMEQQDNPVSRFLRENYGVDSIEEYLGKLEREAWLNYALQNEQNCSLFKTEERLGAGTATYADLSLIFQYLDDSPSPTWQNVPKGGTETYQPTNVKSETETPRFSIQFNPLTELAAFSFFGAVSASLLMIPKTGRKLLRHERIIWIIVLVAAAGTAFSLGQVYSQTQLPNRYIEAYELPYSYMISTDGTYYYATRYDGALAFGGPNNRGGASGTDASAVIQSAINALPTGGKILIKAGEYIIKDAPIRLKSGITLEGEGYSSFLRNIGTPDPNAYTIVAMGSATSPLKNVAVKNLRVKTEATIDDAITFYFVENGLVAENWIEGVGEEGVEILGTSKNIIVRNNIIDGMGSGINSQIDVYYDVSTGTVPSNILIDGNILKNSTNYYAINIFGNNVTVINNLIDTPQSKGIRTGNASGYPLEQITIAENVLVGRTNLVGYGIQALGTSDAVISRLKVIGNQVKDFGGYGIIIQYVNYFGVAKNIVYNCGSAGAYGGVWVQSSNYGNVIGNEIINCGLAPAPNNRDGVHVRESTYVRVANNLIRGCGRNGIMEYGAGTDYNIFENNDVRGNAVISGAPISKVGANTVVRHNVGYLTENSGTATIPAGATYVDVTHGLAITPDINRIKVVPKDNLGGRSFWVSNVTSATFRINISSTDTVDHSFGWSYD